MSEPEPKPKAQGIEDAEVCAVCVGVRVGGEKWMDIVEKSVVVGFREDSWSMQV